MEIGSRAWRQLIKDGAAAMGLTVSPEQAGLFARHAEALLAWNRTTNLTAITAPEAVAVKHFLDAIVPSRYVPPGSAVLDIGSGGGFPGIPIKIMDPSLSVTLIDSVRKKASFLKYVIRTLKIEGITAHHIRAEALAKQADMVRGFDVIVCRALTALADFIRVARPLLKDGGVMIAMKGDISEDEHAPGAIAIDTIHYTLPVLALRRRLYIVLSSGMNL
jgi:16S rRNA (guanine527-N7)-methyltransferase